jgi:hypothetical protein
MRASEEPSPVKVDHLNQPTRQPAPKVGPRGGAGGEGVSLPAGVPTSRPSDPDHWGHLLTKTAPMGGARRRRQVEKAPLESYADVGGLDQQIQEIKEAVELPLTHPELYEDIGIKPPKVPAAPGPPRARRPARRASAARTARGRRAALTRFPQGLPASCRAQLSCILVTASSRGALGQGMLRDED